MKKYKEKTMYESPQTRRTLVNMESGICVSSADIKNPDNKDNGRIEEHQVNTDFGFSFEQQQWDQ